ncbi:MAG TPA: peroxiredoxin [Armatimonadota bacterium]|jgi:peroxiredoxin
MSAEVGAKAPQVRPVDAERNVVSVPAAGEITVLVFFPAAFTSVCQAELCSFRDAIAAFNDVSAKVYGISVDPPFTLAEFAKRNGLNFPLLSDFKHEAIRAYGIEFPNLADIEGYTVARRSVFVIGKDGNVAWSWLAESPANEPDYAAVKSAVAAAK